MFLLRLRLYVDWHLALGHEPLEAARRAKANAAEAVGNGLRSLGAGSGPVDVLGLDRMGVRRAT